MSLVGHNFLLTSPEDFPEKRALGGVKNQKNPQKRHARAKKIEDFYWKKEGSFTCHF
jgi:hypothetical protein